MAYTTINKSSEHFNTTLHTGNGSTQSITGVGFQPDLTWIKRRSADGWHWLTDAVRGTTKTIYSNESNAEETNTNGLTAFGTDGFTVGSNADINGNGQTHVGWNWKAGTTGSGNTGGSGSYKTYSYSVNTTAGFSITTYKGNGTAGHQIPHSLGVAPSMFIIKDLDNIRSWYVYHKNASYSGSNPYSTEMYLDTTDRAYSAGTWNNVAPTSTTFQTSGGSSVNGNDIDYICYAFAEKTGYSKFGSYTGNGNVDGPFVYTGFKPAFVIYKSTNVDYYWKLIDNKTNTGNGNEGAYTHPNTTDYVNSSSLYDDFYSNGFKIRNTNVTGNGSGNSYIYMAFAEAPLVGSNNVPCTAR